MLLLCPYPLAKTSSNEPVKNLEKNKLLPKSLPGRVVRVVGYILRVQRDDLFLRAERDVVHASVLADMCSRI